MTVTSNIHYSLSAWSSGTFTLGQRCSSGGNAYQCTVAGSSTAAPSGTGASINNGGTATFKWLSAINYTSLQAWANALPATLTQGYVAQLWNNGPITTTSGVPYLTLTGHATTPTNSIVITAAPGESFVNAGASGPLPDPYDLGFATDFGGGSGTGAQLPLAFSSTNGVNFVLPSSGSGGVNYILIQDTNVLISGLQFQDPNSGSNSTILQPTQTVTVQNCIFDGYGQTGGATIIDASLGGPATSLFSLLNCLVVDRATSGAGVSVWGNYNSTVANCTLVMPTPTAGQGGIVNYTVATSITTKVINTIVSGYDAADAVGADDTASMAVSYSLFTAASLTGNGVTQGSGNLFSKTASSTFAAPGTDYRLAATSSALNAGFTDTADIPAAIDIYGSTRPQGTAWDIGADEYLIQNTASVGVVNGQGSAAGVSGVAAVAKGTANGHGSAAGVSFVGYVSSGTANGHASAAGVSTANASIGNAAGHATVIGFVATGSITAAVTLNPVGTQVVGTPFLASGTYTLYPNLQFADDASVTFTPIPSSGVSALGETNYTFVHPGLPTPGTYNLLVEDLSTDQAAARNYAVVATAPPPPPPVQQEVTGLTALSTIIPAYLYEEYFDDENLQGFIQAYNNMAQVYLDWFNSINLPIYTGTPIAGALLDWVAEGLYGITRPTLAVVQVSPSNGPFNTYDFNTIPLNGSSGNTSTTLFTVTDDIFKRIITWSFYKGDGKVFNTLWLKRRVARFLAGVNGTDYTGPTDQISVTYTGTTTVNITISNGSIPLTVAPIFQAAILSGNLPLPFQFNFNVLISN